MMTGTGVLSWMLSLRQRAQIAAVYGSGGCVTKCSDGLTRRKVGMERELGMWKRGWVKATMCYGQESEVGESWSRAVWVELSEEGSLEGERTRLGLASITPACPWSFHTAQNKRDLSPLDRRAAPVTAKGAIAFIEYSYCSHEAGCSLGLVCQAYIPRLCTEYKYMLHTLWCWLPHRTRLG